MQSDWPGFPHIPTRLSDDTKPSSDTTAEQHVHVPPPAAGGHHHESSGEPSAEESGGGAPETVVVVTKEGMAASGEPNPTDMVEEPAKVMRIGSMVKQLLEEVRSAPLDDAGRTRLAQVHQQSIAELKAGLSPDLVAELERITLPFSEDETPSDAELRIAQAQLVGWLEGLFHGIQTALFAQQMAMQNQLQQMRKALPPGAAGSDESNEGDQPRHQGTGQYL